MKTNYHRIGYMFICCGAEVIETKDDSWEDVVLCLWLLLTFCIHRMEGSRVSSIYLDEYKN